METTSTTTSEEKSNSLLTEIPALQTHGLLSSVSAHPLVGVLAAAYVLGVLYLPRHLLSFFLSPVPLSTLFFLATLLRFGSRDRPRPCTPPPTSRLGDPEPAEVDQRRCRAGHDAATKPASAVVVFSPEKPLFSGEHHFVQWPCCGPLEVIYEEYEGEEEDGEGESPEYSLSPEYGGRLGLGSLGICFYTDSSGTGSDSGGEGSSSPTWDSPENLCFRWEAEGLIEIPLEEESLIEIDISACR